MAKSKIPSPLERRHLLERDLPAGQALAIAEAYLEDDRFEEAVALLARAGADDRLQVLADQAVATGDAFLLAEIAREQDREPDAETRAQRGQILLEGVDNKPLLIVDRVEKGRVAVLLSDQIWLWARGYLQTVQLVA